MRSITVTSGSSLNPAPSMHEVFEGRQLEGGRWDEGERIRPDVSHVPLTGLLNGTDQDLSLDKDPLSELT